MEKVQVLDWIVSFDKELTTSYYQTYPIVTEVCDCIYCQNYLQACSLISEEIKIFLQMFGVNIEKTQELFHCCDNDDNTSKYWGFLDIIGSFEEAPSSIVCTGVLPPDQEKGIGETQVFHYEMNPFLKGFEIGFVNRTNITLENTSHKAICLTFNVDMPKLLDFES